MQEKFILIKPFYFIISLICGASISIGMGSCASPQDILGTWDILGELVTSPGENPYDPNAPKPGDVKPDTWTIEDPGEGPVLTSSAGTLSGQYSGEGGVFEGTYPIGSGVYMFVHIECFLSGSASMYGTIENQFWGTNTFTGELIKTGVEAWKFKAVKK